MRKISLAVFLFLSVGLVAIAQKGEKKILVKPDLHFRTFWMNTTYPGLELKKDYALGMSMNLGTKLVFQKRWEFQVGYRLFGNVASSPIWENDPKTGQSNRYESGLFDLLNPADRYFGKLETLTLGYESESFGIQVGRMGIQSDWINAQDGRLSPTAVEGVHFWIKPLPKWKLSAWGIGRMSIRGSSEWLDVGKSIGIYPQGRTTSGQPGKYFENTTSDWISILEIDRQMGRDSKLHFSNTFVQNVFSTYWIALESKWPQKERILLGGLQAGLQHGVGDGGNGESIYQYKNPEDVNFSLSGRVGWQSRRWLTHLNYTHVGGKGQWLSPREWGKDAWFTFIPRERNEGYSTVNALVAYTEYRMEKIPIQVYIHGGLHWLSDISDARANKYNFPSYRQINAGIKYQPRNLKGLEIHFLLVSKQPLSEQSLSLNQIYNKVEMLHFNGMVNWRWR